nr:MAG TPA: YsxB-like protein [Caudoviricetes sp.]
MGRISTAANNGECLFYLKGRIELIEIKVRDHEIAVIGHADYAACGKDIVCASVSMLLQNLAKSIHDLTNDKIEYDLKAGQAFIKYRNLSEKSKTLIDSFFIGICSISDAYPDYVRIV